MQIPVHKVTINKGSFVRYMKSNGMLYLFLVPGLIFFVLFIYIPMLGGITSFQSYNPILGFFRSKFVGFDNFQTLFSSPRFLLTVKNTIVINFLKLIFIFPAPIILALIFNEIGGAKFKKINQTISYLPHFVSWVVVAGLWYRLLSPNNGAINDLLQLLHLIDDKIFFIGEIKYYYPVIILQELWKEIGFNSIYYIAALATVDIELNDSAKVDGANRFQRIFHISIPGILTTIVLLFILTLSNILNANFDQMLMMINEQVKEVGDVIDTYVYRILMNGLPREIGVGVALSLFKGIIGLSLFLIANRFVKKYTERSFI